MDEPTIARQHRLRRDALCRGAARDTAAGHRARLERLGATAAGGASTLDARYCGDAASRTAAQSAAVDRTVGRDRSGTLYEST